MKKSVIILCFLFAGLTSMMPASAQSKLKIVIIRHGEKQEKYENLNCMGLNRSLKLVNVLHKKIGVPDYIYVPSVGNGATTTHSRMFQTITPFAVTYNLSINSRFGSADLEKIAADLKDKKGVVLFVWNHENIVALAKALGVKVKGLKWSNSDFDSMWTITGKGKNRTLEADREGIVPGQNCGSY
ncbi:hypothetical protein [Pedobacter hartonius]|uniref:Histidine phosphatase superfamily (Branch 1) n=1 Tax=Pedobacter hartonius TaxID=425514 RepID=A0A1H3Z8X6_9SPHI|nr:hypothetical protein [Pedobacter hartonius]SEA19782.1 hypothetical protein SAMN05443550_102268 [Pedobacter hartonius]